VRVFQIIDDPDAVAWAPVGNSLLSTLRLGVTSLLELVEAASRPMPAARINPGLPEITSPMSGAFVMHTIAQVMPHDAAIVEEAPSHRNNLHDYLPICRSQGFFTGASGGLGYSLPAAVGIALAEPTRRVICLLGDGSSMYSVQGLWSAAQLHLPITFVVFNNREYAALKAFGQMLDTPDFTGVDLPGIDIVSIARGYGCEALCVEKGEDLPGVLTKSFASVGPVVIDIMIDPAIEILY
jgi:benzoylformate decarboxylase